MCLKITVINQACKFCYPSLPALITAASSGHPSQGRKLGSVILTCIQILWGRQSHERLSKQAGAKDRNYFLRCNRGSTYCQSTHTLQARYVFSLVHQLSNIAMLPHSIARS